jgi:hypothetical protein
VEQGKIVDWANKKEGAMVGVRLFATTAKGSNNVPAHAGSGEAGL